MGIEEEVFRVFLGDVIEISNGVEYFFGEGRLRSVVDSCVDYLGENDI